MLHQIKCRPRKRVILCKGVCGVNRDCFQNMLSSEQSIYWENGRHSLSFVNSSEVAVDKSSVFYNGQLFIRFRQNTLSAGGLQGLARRTASTCPVEILTKSKVRKSEGRSNATQFRLIPRRLQWGVLLIFWNNIS